MLFMKQQPAAPGNSHSDGQLCIFVSTSGMIFYSCLTTLHDLCVTCDMFYYIVTLSFSIFIKISIMSFFIYIPLLLGMSSCDKMAIISIARLCFAALWCLLALSVLFFFIKQDTGSTIYTTIQMLSSCFDCPVLFSFNKVPVDLLSQLLIFFFFQI